MEPIAIKHYLCVSYIKAFFKHSTDVEKKSLYKLELMKAPINAVSIVYLFCDKRVIF